LQERLVSRYREIAVGGGLVRPGFV
jgi:hypothetical protein